MPPVRLADARLVSPEPGLRCGVLMTSGFMTGAVVDADRAGLL